MGVPFPALKTMVTVFLLLMGNVSPVHSTDWLSVADTVASIASSAITAGTSLIGTSLQSLGQTDVSVWCAIQVENWTRYPLMYPTVRTSGYPAITTPPFAILPTKKEAFAVEKPRLTATGTWGTVSWEMVGADQRLVIMWSTPFNFDFYMNWLGLGITGKGNVNVAGGNSWLYQMYSGSSSKSLAFTRKPFYYDAKFLLYRNDKFEVEGTMSNIHKAVVKVVVRPVKTNWRDLALPIQMSLVEEKGDLCSLPATG